jgi:ABC-type transport system involved in multi-copper enzyme maturation permease subunit
MNDILYYLKLEWSKYSKNWLVRVLFLTFTILFPFVIFLGKEVFENVPPPFPSYTMFYEFPTVWDYQGHVGNWLVSFCLGFLIIYMVTSEVDYRTMRQGVINGMTRKEFFLAKFSSVIALSIYATLLFYVTAIIIGIFNTEAPDIELIFDNNYAGFRFFLMSMGYLSFAFLLAIIIRRGFLSLLAYFSYMMFVETIIRAFHLYYFQHRSVLFYPMNAIEDIMPNKLYSYADFWMKNEFENGFLLSNMESAIAGLIYTTIFIAGSWFFFKNSDL